MEGRHFSLEQAQELVPWLEAKLEDLNGSRRAVSRLEEEISHLMGQMSSNGGHDAGEKLESQHTALKEASETLERQVKEVHAQGIELKSIERGLADFPAQRDGREVYLCWQRGESDIRFWHEVDTGFAGRQSL